MFRQGGGAEEGEEWAEGGLRARAAGISGEMRWRREDAYLGAVRRPLCTPNAKAMPAEKKGLGGPVDRKATLRGVQIKRFVDLSDVGDASDDTLACARADEVENRRDGGVHEELPVR